MYAILLSCYLEIKISTFVTQLSSGVSFSVKNSRLIVTKGAYETEIAKIIESAADGVTLNNLKLFTGKADDIASVEAKFAKVSDNGTKGYELIKTKSGQFWLREVTGAGKIFTTAELKLLKRADLADFVRNNLDNLLTDANKNAIWSLTDEASGQFKRGDLIEEIFNQWSSKYKNYQNLNDVIPNYPTLDFDGILNNLSEVVSLKTYHPTSATTKTLSLINGKISNYADKLSSATLAPAHVGKARVLDFTIKKGEWTSFMDDILNHADKVGKQKGIIIRITEF